MSNRLVKGQLAFPRNNGDEEGQDEQLEQEERHVYSILDINRGRIGINGPATSSPSNIASTGNPRNPGNPGNPANIGDARALGSNSSGTPSPIANPLLAVSSRSTWLPILENSNQLVLYNPTSHALTITQSSLPPVPVSFPRSRSNTNTNMNTNTNTSSAVVPTRKMLRSQSYREERSGSHPHGHDLDDLDGLDDLDLALNVGHAQNRNNLTASDATREVSLCPMCTRPLPPGFGLGRMRSPHAHAHTHAHAHSHGHGHGHGLETSSFGGRQGISRRVPNYFQLLEEANFEAQSRPASPPLDHFPNFPLSATLSALPSGPPDPSESESQQHYHYPLSHLSSDFPIIESIDPSLESLASTSTSSSTSISISTSTPHHGHGHGHIPVQVHTQAKPDVLSRVRAKLQVAAGIGGGGTNSADNGTALGGSGSGSGTGITNDDSVPGTPKRRFGENSMAQGYFAAFFREEKRLGMGANGSVHLCQHVLDGNSLGHFAVKKIAVGHSHEYLLRILKEVRLLETLRHPNVVSYHHSWLETTKLSSFGPSVPTLYVLMEWAECGSLDDLIDLRQGKKLPSVITTPSGGLIDDEDENDGSKSARIRAFKAAKQNQAAGAAGGQARRASTGASAGVHLLSVDEIKSFFSDIVSGLAFLHDRSILHLDLKLGNVLLTKDEDRIIPRAMLSDFGTSQDALQGPRVRSGNTGTVEYCAPEALARDQNGSLLPIDSRSDMWSLGMILHKLIFFRLPYPEIDAADKDGIEREVLAYPGWKANPDIFAACKRRGLPRAILVLLEGLLNRNPRERPTSERVLHALREGTLESNVRIPKESSIVARRRSISEENSRATSPPSALALQKLSEPPSPVIYFEDRNNNALPETPSSQSSGIQTRKRTPTPPLLQDGESDSLSGRAGGLPSSLATIAVGLDTLARILAKLLIPQTLRPYVRTMHAQARWRAVKLALLVLKIISMGSVCRPAHVVHWTQALIISIAVMDIWYESEVNGVSGRDRRGPRDGDEELAGPVFTVLLCITHLLLLSVVRWRRDTLCVL